MHKPADPTELAGMVTAENSYTHAVGLIGENDNAITQAFASSLIACPNIRLVWFADATLKSEIRERLYGNYFSWGRFGDLVRRVRTFLKRQKRKSSCREIMKKAGIPVYVPRNGNINDGLPDAFYARSGADYVLVAGCDQLLNGRALSLARKRTMNFHWSLLPAYRGKFAVFWQWYLAEPNIGFSFHEVDAGVDTGKVIYQEEVPQRDIGSLEQLSRRIVERAAAVVCMVFDDAGSGKQTVFPGAIKPSYFPAKKFLDLITVSRSKSTSELTEIFARVGYLRLRNGFLIHALERVSNVPIDGYVVKGGVLYIPLSDGHMAMRIGRLRGLFAAKVLAGLD
jgi:folate-dependent phosphoribosylglycinamide formyltransferase PurN